MVYINGQPSVDYDIDSGVLESREVEVTHTWNGSSWVTTDAAGETVGGYDGPLPDDPSASPVSNTWTCYDYRPYTQAERDALDACDKANAMRAIWEENAPQVQADTDAALCELWEQLLAQQNTIDDQDSALCAVYELAIGA